jgi:hypothetical protein
MLICAHISGGGDWEWAIKAARPAPNLMLDTSGASRMTLRGYGGAEVGVFGCDPPADVGWAKCGADLSVRTRKIRGT